MGEVGIEVAIDRGCGPNYSESIKLSCAIGLARAMAWNMKQNIYFELLVAGLLMAGALVKSVNQPFGMPVHEMSVLLVIINAMRLLGYGRAASNKG